MNKYISVDAKVVFGGAITKAENHFYNMQINETGIPTGILPTKCWY
jgi:hypothetical protein